MEMNCRFCNTILEDVFADLGETPLANSYLTQETVEKKIKFIEDEVLSKHDIEKILYSYIEETGSLWADLAKQNF